MWNPDWADAMNGGRTKRTVMGVVNTRDAVKTWLKNNATNFEPEQTFALDSWSFLQDACDLQTHAEDDISGKVDGYFFWKWKLRYSKEIIQLLKTMRCRVVVTFHETRDRDAAGNLNGKLKPVQDGSYKDVILGAFTDVWRQKGNVPVLDESGKAKLDQKGNKITGGYVWQLIGDTLIDTNMNPTLGRIVRQRNIQQIPVVFGDDNKPHGGYETIQSLYAASAT